MSAHPSNDRNSRIPKLTTDTLNVVTISFLMRRRDEVKVFALATRDDDKLFSSFVHSIMLATLYAQESGITHESNRGMPLMSVFGTQYLWAMRDAIAHSGSYDEMYYKHFGTSPLQRGRNELNINATPQLLSPPMNFG